MLRLGRWPDRIDWPEVRLVFEMAVMWRIAGISRWDRRRNVDIRKDLWINWRGTPQPNLRKRSLFPPQLMHELTLPTPKYTHAFTLLTPTYAWANFPHPKTYACVPSPHPNLRMRSLFPPHLVHELTLPTPSHACAHSPHHSLRITRSLPHPSSGLPAHSSTAWLFFRNASVHSSMFYSISGMNIFVAFFVLLLLLADITPPATSTIPLIGELTGTLTSLILYHRYVAALASLIGKSPLSPH